MGALPVRGGPADGERWGAGALAPGFYFLDFGGAEYVYRRAPDAWVFMGSAARRCGGCGAVVTCPRSEPCPLCGAEAARAPGPPPR